MSLWDGKHTFIIQYLVSTYMTGLLDLSIDKADLLFGKHPFYCNGTAWGLAQYM